MELKDWIDVFFKTWMAIIATAALIVNVKKEKTAKRKPHAKRKRKR